MTNTVITVNKLIAIFKSIADRHMMVNDFFFGPTYNIGARVEMKFPYLAVEPDSAIVEIENSQMIGSYAFNVMVMDKINKGDQNYNELLSDTDFILNNIIAEFLGSSYYRENDIRLIGNITKEPAQEVTNDNVNGWMATISLRFPIRYNSCVIPIEDCGCPTDFDDDAPPIEHSASPSPINP